MSYERRKSGLIVPKGVTRRAFLTGLVAAPALVRATAADARFVTNQLVGFNAKTLTVAPTLEFAYLQRTENSSTSASYTFPSENLGAADVNRRVLVSAQTVHTAGAPPFSCTSASIQGIGAAVHTGAEVSHQPAAIGSHVCWFSAIVPTGTTGNIVINYSESTFRCIIAVYRVVNLQNTTPLAQQTSTAHPGSISLTEPASGIMVAAITSDTGGTCAWVGLANTDHNSVRSGGTDFYSGASELITSGSGSRAITATITGAGSTRAMGGLSWA